MIVSKKVKMFLNIGSGFYNCASIPTKQDRYMLDQSALEIIDCLVSFFLI